MANRQDYSAIALVISKVQGARTRTELAVAIGRYFAADNPNFNLDVWYSACRAYPVMLKEDSDRPDDN